MGGESIEKKPLMQMDGGGRGGGQRFGEGGLFIYQAVRKGSLIISRELFAQHSLILTPV